MAHTKSRFEKALGWDLLNRGIDYFLPLLKQTRVYSGKKRQAMVPLFTSYVFVCGGEAARYAALQTNRLSRILDVPDQARFVAEITAIERALAGEVQLRPYHNLPVGRRCRVTGGALQGLEGIVVRQSSAAALVLELSILGQGALAEIAPEMLEPVD